jgi:hypothetical protein
MPISAIVLIIVFFYNYKKLVKNVKTCLAVDMIRVSLMIYPVADLLNKHSFLLLYNIQKEATISTYTDGAKSMMKVHTDNLNNIDRISSFK